MAFVFSPEAPIAAPVVGTNDSIAVRRVYCIGRNYAAHAREMGFDPDREPPFFFLKPDNTVVPVGYDETLSLEYPTETQNYHYEAELVAVIGKSGSNIPLEQALDYVWGYAVGLDMTRRDLQMKMREMGRPWEIGKAFDRSAPLGPIHPVTHVGHFETGDIWLSVNGETKQKSNITHLIWSVAESVAYLSKFFTLEPGDLIYTGTPEGVGPVKVGDTINVGIERLGELTVKIV
ncbi:fumarylacetoacetate hydrolase family protein [Paraburkholderia fungorum]|jgi:fumarylpyruvate hydrolase|uniref:fumarylacetoacetate hydrolase family protein n=1 Tax=Paraburkholderia fungorum TaxID=134537 RepID=UPI00041F195B|nr:fumarylacetoacetate hydrolase family protein [Paraburkholderia fungorum]PZR38146.1 MAG: 5-carboxymethyl-2-hydroxymuconate isomerase [Paraburkholderia fungorum]